MKNWIVILLCLMNGGVQAQKDSDHNIDPIQLENLSLYFEGSIPQPDNYLMLSASLSIAKDGNDLVASSTTSLHCGTQKEEVWQTVLTKKMIRELEAFCTKVKQAQEDVYTPGFNTEYYVASYNSKTWKVSPNSNILSAGKISQHGVPFENLSFFMRIFSKQIKELNTCREKHEIKINKQLAKVWYLSDNQKDTLERGSRIVLSSTPNSSTQNYWNFGKDFTFIATRDTSVKKGGFQVEYHAHSATPDYMYLSMHDVKMLFHRRDLQAWDSPNSYYVISISDTELVLEIAY